MCCSHPLGLVAGVSGSIPGEGAMLAPVGGARVWEGKIIMTHPYFEAKAAHVLRAAGGEPTSGELAAWAEKARQNDDSRSGAVVTRSGDVVAVTRYVPTFPEGGATYVTGVSSPCLEYLMNTEVGLAMARVRLDVVHVRYSEVCQGPRPPV
jgi:hypothetical protein